MKHKKGKQVIPLLNNQTEEQPCNSVCSYYADLYMVLIGQLHMPATSVPVLII